MNRTTLLTISLCSLAVLSATYCTVEKRRYTKGFYITSKTKPVHRSPHVRIDRQVPLEVHKKEKPILQPANDFSDKSPVYAHATKYSPPFVEHKKLILPPDSCSDVITFMDGSELKIRIEEITPAYVAYRRCDYLDGPLIKSAPSEIFRLKYGNGIVRVFEHHQNAVATQQPEYYKSEPLKTSGWAIASFVTACFSFLLIPAFAAVILGIIALVQFENNPGKFKGKWMAVAGLVIGAFALVIFLLFFIV